jgi:hypothetical protein
LCDVGGPTILSTAHANLPSKPDGGRAFRVDSKSRRGTSELCRTERLTLDAPGHVARDRETSAHAGTCSRHMAWPCVHAQLSNAASLPRLCSRRLLVDSRILIQSFDSGWVFTVNLLAVVGGVGCLVLTRGMCDISGLGKQYHFVF